jgi:hypothetical protein
MLRLLPGTYSVLRLGPRAKVPRWAAGGGFSCVTRTRTELSIVCRQDRLPTSIRRESGFRCLGVAGPLEFDAVGVLASLAGPLARARVPILAISTFDTDYLLVRGEHLARAVRALTRAGHRVVGAVE